MFCYPDPGGRNETNPYGSGSATLLYLAIMLFRALNVVEYHMRRVNVWIFDHRIEVALLVIGRKEIIIIYSYFVEKKCLYTILSSFGLPSK